MSESARTRWIATVFVMLACFVAADVDARMRPVKPGEVPDLSADQAFVVVAVDSTLPLYRVRVARDGRMFGSGSLRQVPAGSDYQLFVSTSGQYQWREVMPNQFLTYGLDDDPEFSFQVTAGQINYPGDLLFRPIGAWRANISVYNRALAAMDWLERTHPGLLSRYHFAYAGHYPDPFPAFYRQELGKGNGTRPEPVHARLAVSADSGELPLLPEQLWRHGGIVEAHLSPAGRWVALLSRVENGDWLIELVDLQRQTSRLLVRSELALGAIQWSGDRHLLSSASFLGNRRPIDVFSILDPDAVEPKIVHTRFRQYGYIVDVVPDAPDRILFGTTGRRGVFSVHPVDLSKTNDIRAISRPTFDRLNKVMSDDVNWFTDGRGQLRVALVHRREQYLLVDGGSDPPKELLNLSTNRDFSPIALSFDGNTLFGLSDHQREQREVVAFETSDGAMATVYSKPGVDIQSVVFDQRRQPVGVRYYEAGLLISEYFDDESLHLNRMLEEAFPAMSISLVDRSRDGRHLILWVDAADKPARLYHLDLESREAALLGHHMPWLQEYDFAPVHSIRFESKEGQILDAFLTLPEMDGDRPMVVFPHGGPVGVADSRHFDREVQFLASLGYAVLQVNFRGSDGYGRAFREAGLQGHGTLIEDDIDAAVRHAVERFPINEQRMCVLGSSYGGYSGLVAVVRWPQRFRCAVSIAGVSDLPLTFTASDVGRNKEGRAALERTMGNPTQRLEHLKDTSPLYQYENIRVPVMLVHGHEDRRVDFEHSRRLARMLRHSGNEPVGIEFPDEGHGIAKHESIIAMWRAIAGFLRQHL